MEQSTYPGPCNACAKFESVERWRALPLLRSLGATDLVPFVTTTWSDRVIEVRQCLRCGRKMARVVSPRAPVA